MLTNQIDELALTYLRTTITQLEKKSEQIIKVDERIIELIEGAEELETEAEESQDLILEKINELNKRVETLSREATVPVSSPQTLDDKAPNSDDSTTQEKSGDKVATKDIHNNVSITTSTPYY